MIVERFQFGGGESFSARPRTARALRRGLRSALGIGLVLLCMLKGGPGWSQSHVPFADRGTGQKVALVAGAGACSVLYTPAKAIYATGGAIAGSLVFLMSAGQSSAAAGRIFDRTGRGDWYVHPDHLTGVRPLHFRGETVGPPGTAW